jgi:hypothetical protein
MANLRGGLSAALALVTAAGAGLASAQTPSDVYATYGVHNSSNAQDCAYPTCVYTRTAGQPTDPKYPAYWTSRWRMYRVYNGYQDHPPPYTGKPPAPLKDGVDYQTSWGASYYDADWNGPLGRGAMEERYDHYCLPIFPFDNHYSCAFISLGDTAFFVTFADRPSWMPPVCLFSPQNHPPERDFIKHLPYVPADSQRLRPKGQGYSFWVSQAGEITQVGAAPDQTANGGILFGYAFAAHATPDRVDKAAPPYRHPLSFYFSGVPKLKDLPLPNAPIVSQNYTDFAMIRPDPAKTWALVDELNPKKLPPCQLFNPPAAALAGVRGAARPPANIPTWGGIGSR